MADYTLLEEVAEYVGFTPEDATLLEQVGPSLTDGFPGLIDRFYEAVMANPRARAVFADDEQIERQKQKLAHWFSCLFGGVYDSKYLEKRSRIGRVHVDIGLDQRFMLAGMDIIRRGLQELLDDAVAGARWPADRHGAARAAIDKICDIELAIMLESYRDAYSERLRGSERLAALGQLAASIGHELRNPLAVMESSRKLLERRVPQDVRIIKHVDRIGDQIKVSTSIIDGLLELTRDRPPSRELTDLRTVVDEALGSVRDRPGVTVETSMPDELRRANVDPVQIRQVVVNLVTNAAQSMKDATMQGRIIVRVVEDGTTLTLRVEDEGPGISPEARKRLFEPLFTTRARGTGLGLPLCRRIVRGHGGTIDVGDADGGGAVFEVVIPDCLEPPPA